MVAIVDYGVGNLMAIQNIIKKAGGQCLVTGDPKLISDADKIVLPGVGSFSYGMDELLRRNLVDILSAEVLERKKTILGLCLGAQLMTQQSEEGNRKGFGWVNAVTKKFDERYVSVTPHMNWADVKFVRPNALSEGLQSESRFYFVHSYHFQFFDDQQIIGTAFHGYEFACAFQRDNIFGVQFHPEKSHRYGVRLFQNFLKL